MNRGIEAFNELKEGHWFDFADTYFSLNPKLKMDLNIIEQELRDYDRQRQKAIIYRKFIENNEDKLEAFELAMKNPLAFATLNLYLNDTYEEWKRYYTKKEFNLLKKLLRSRGEEVKTNE